MRPIKPKLPFGVTQDFLDEIVSISTDDLKQRIVTMQINHEETSVFLKENDSIQKARDELKSLEASPKETLRSIKNRIRASIRSLKERGAA